MDIQSLVKMESVMQKRSRILPGLLTFFLFVILATSVSAGTSGFGKVDVISNCPNNQCPLFNNPDGVWVFSWVDNGFTTEKINAFFDKEEDLTVDDKVSEQDFSIEIGSSNQFCIYDINTFALCQAVSFDNNRILDLF